MIPMNRKTNDPVPCNELALKIKLDFPLLSREMAGKKLVYLDSTATTQKPQVVLDAELKYYQETNANVHRGLYTLAEDATTQYEQARMKVAEFIGAQYEEVIFTSGTTSSINMAARLLEPLVKEGDEIVITIMEHHSNFLPWQQLAKRKKCVLKIIPITKEYGLDMAAAQKIITSKTKIVACTYVSNVLGTINAVGEVIEMAKRVGAYTLIDGAQAVPHMMLEVKKLGCDFLAFSGHKMCGPTGIGVLYGKRELLEKLEPVVFGGEMVKEATLHTLSWNELPWKFEAGTPNIAGAIALGTAVAYIQEIFTLQMQEHLGDLTKYALAEMQTLPGLQIIGPRGEEMEKGEKIERIGVISFTMDCAHPHDIAEILNSHGVCIRAGHHCAMPLHTTLAIPATARVSFYVYNTKEDVDALMRGLRRVVEVFA